MRIAMFYHSLASDWNHGNAHFLRGVASGLQRRNHEVHVYEPSQGWSLSNLVRDHGTAASLAFRDVYPSLHPLYYDPADYDLDALLADVDLVLVHEWNDAELVAAIGQHHAATNSYRLLFHDTHHRSASQPEQMQQYDLTHYDGVLAFGEVIRERYRTNGWKDQVWTWHEAADVEVFHPKQPVGEQQDLVWVGNWGDDERTAELHEFLIEPVRKLGLGANVFGVRYPEEAIQHLGAAGITYGGYLPNHRVPDVFAQHRMTVHVPRRPYVESLPGVPTIRPFEAMACGIPLISAPWHDAEGLFTPGEDYLVARNGEEMVRHMRRLLDDPQQAAQQAERARRTILSRHTCAHRVDQLLTICDELGLPADDTAPSPTANA